MSYKGTNEANNHFKVAEILSDKIVIIAEGRRWYAEPKYCEPIPLTAEILEKNGFERDDTDTAYVWFTIDKIGTDENYEIIIKWCDSYDNGAADAFNRVSWKEHWTLHAMCNRKSIDIEPTECIYVHELQHILKLLDIDKEIEL